MAIFSDATPPNKKGSPGNFNVSDFLGTEQYERTGAYSNVTPEEIEGIRIQMIDGSGPTHFDTSGLEGVTGGQTVSVGDTGYAPSLASNDGNYQQDISNRHTQQQLLNNQQAARAK